VLRRELERFDAGLARRPGLVALSKLDLPEVRAELPALREALAAQGVELLAFSAATGEGVEALLDRLERLLAEHPLPSRPRAAPLPTAADRPHGQPENIDS
jgi:GTP-binding protein